MEQPELEWEVQTSNALRVLLKIRKKGLLLRENLMSDGGGGGDRQNGQSDHMNMAPPLCASGTSSGPGVRKGAGQR